MPSGETVHAVIWDFDGVILDNELLHLEAELDTVRFFGIPLTREIALEYLGVRLEDYFGALIARYGAGDASGELLGRMLSRHIATLRRYYGEVFPLSPRLHETLDALGPRYPMGIATNRERELVELALGRFSLSRRFHTVVCKEEVKRGKPHPDMFLKAASLMRVEPVRVAVVEDSHTGFRAAKAAGMFLIARRAAHNRHLDFSLADRVVEDLRDVVGILMGAQ